MSAVYVGSAVAGALVSSQMGNSSGQTTQTGSSSPWIGQQPYLTNGFQNAQNWYNGTQGSTNPVTGQYTPGTPGGTQVAPLNQMQNQSFQMAQNQANNPTLQAAQQSNQNFSNGSMMNNPYLDQMANAADNSITRNYQNAVDPGIQSNASANGRYGSGAMTNMQGQAQQNLATQLGNTNAGIYGNAYQQGMNNMLTANGQAGALNQAQLSNIQGLNAAGNQQQAQQQTVNGQPLANMQAYQGLINGNFGGQTSQSTPYYQNNMANAMGGALGGMQLMNAYNQNSKPAQPSSGSPGSNATSPYGAGNEWMSDPRVKENVKLVGKTAHDLNLYEFNYIGGDKTYRGVMSNEVELIMPEAVVKGGEFDKVNYDMLGIKMEEV